MFCHLSSNLATPSQNAASTSNTTSTKPPANLNPNPVIDLAINLVLNPLAMPPAPAGMDLTIWVNNQALIMVLLL